MATKKKTTSATAATTEATNAGTAAAAESAETVETKPIISSHPNGFVHQGELLAILQNFEDRLAKLEELAGVGETDDDGDGDPA